ncbi:MAG: hypothetical protein ACLFVG_00480 [Candidatus Aminicenantes bacterium]
MKNKETPAVMFSLLLTSGLFFHCHSSNINQEEEERKKIEHYLKTAEIVTVEKDEQAGRTAPWRIKLDDGKKARPGLFKHLDRRRPSLFADSYKYELAAYELNKLLHLNIVPPVVEREIEGKKGALQLFIQDALPESNRKRRNIAPPRLEDHQNILEMINVFENLVYDEECFDAEDTLIDRKEWKVWRVDFSMAFSPTSGLIPGCRISRCSRKLYQNLVELDADTVRAELKPYLNPQEIDAVLKRKSIIIDKIKKLIEEKGEDSVLFLQKHKGGLSWKKHPQVSFIRHSEFSLLSTLTRSPQRCF